MNFTPQYIIPFKKTREDAVEIYSDYIEKYDYLPRAFSPENADLHMKQTYVPVYFVNAKAEADIDFEVTRIRQDESVDYRLCRSGECTIDNLVVGGSPYIYDDVLSCVGKYDLKDAVKYSTELTAGTVVSDSKLPGDSFSDIVDDAIMNKVEEAFTDTIKEKETIYVDERNITITEKNVKCVLIPVWVLQITKKHYTYTILINGQTGKITAELPPNGKKYWTRFAILTAIIATMLFCVVHFASTAFAATSEEKALKDAEKARAQADYELHIDQRVIDNAGVLTDKEIDGLSYWADENSRKNGADFVILIEPSISGSIEKHGKFFLAENDYGISEYDDALIFVYNVSKKTATVVTSGFLDEAINKYGLEYMSNDIKAELDEKDINGACCKFLDDGEFLIKRYKKGEPYGKKDTETYWESFSNFEMDFSPILAAFSSLVIGAIIAIIIVSRQRDKLVVYHQRNREANMAPEVKLNITASKDIKH